MLCLWTKLGPGLRPSSAAAAEGWVLGLPGSDSHRVCIHWSHRIVANKEAVFTGCPPGTQEQREQIEIHTSFSLFWKRVYLRTLFKIHCKYHVSNVASFYGLNESLPRVPRAYVLLLCPLFLALPYFWKLLVSLTRSLHVSSSFCGYCTSHRRLDFLTASGLAFINPTEPEQMKKYFWKGTGTAPLLLPSQLVQA